jgi:hypothetical protein
LEGTFYPYNSLKWYEKYDKAPKRIQRIRQ